MPSAPKLTLAALFTCSLACSEKKSAPPDETATSEAAAAEAPSGQKMPKLDPLESSPKPIPLSEPIPERRAPQACLRPPAAPPFAALFHRRGPGGADRYVFFKSGDGVVAYHRDDRIELFVKEKGGGVRAFWMEPGGEDLSKAELSADRDEWSEVSSPFDASALEDVKPGLMALRPRRCAEVQMTEGKVDGRDARVLALPGLGLPESVEIAREAGEEKIVLMGFLSAEPYESLVERARAEEK